MSSSLRILCYNSLAVSWFPDWAVASTKCASLRLTFCAAHTGDEDSIFLMHSSSFVHNGPIFDDFTFSEVNSRSN